MPTAIREQLISAICTAVTGKYGLPAPEDERELPVTIVQEFTEEAGTDYDATTLVLPIAVAKAEKATSSDRDALRQQAHTLLASITTDMHADETFGGLADGVDYTSGGIQLEIGKFVFAEAQFNIRYHHLRGDPFNLE